jgi:hypothetical protein
LGAPILLEKSPDFGRGFSVLWGAERKSERIQERTSSFHPFWEVFRVWFSGELILCVSKPILKEYFDVPDHFQFDREAFFGRLVTAFERGPNILFVDNPKEQNWIEDDPADNKFITCAFSLHAEYIGPAIYT